MNDNVDKLINQLKKHEGLKFSAYEDTEGYITIGYGRMIDERIGGRISEKEAEFLLMNDIEKTMEEAKKMAFYEKLDPVRKAVVVNMLFNMGLPRFNTFVKFQQALGTGDFQRAADEMLNSKWAKQVKGRAVELSKQMQKGEWQ